MEKNKSKITDPERILTLANFISLIRVFLVIPIIYYLQKPESTLILLILIIIAIASDALDGFFARKAREVTHLGMWLDPLADSIVIVSVTFYLVLLGTFPMWFFALFIIRYASIALPGLYFINNTNFVNSANKPGKWATAAVALMIVLHIFQFPYKEYLRSISLWIAFILLMISWIMYIKRYLVEFKKI
ncbi:CDP-alcohol phosphatidyltransferase family protein [bacterium]|nr:CDP-alcohol phosphatidyltransferase family protein [bacterium]